MRITEFANSWLNNAKEFKKKLSLALDGKSLRTVITGFFKGIPYRWEIILKQIKDLRNTNYELGLLHYNKGNLSDAIFRFKLLKYFYSDLVLLDYYIGRCYIERNQLTKALPYIEKYLKSEDKEFRSEGKYCYDLINKRVQNIKIIPLSIIQRTFDLLAPKYDDIFLNKANIPQNELYKSISGYVNEIAVPYGNRVLDLGCGTGYIVEMLKLKNIASSTYGVDISSKMIDICNHLKVQNIPCYDKLINEDVETFLNKPQDSKFNIIIASKILNYLSNIESLIILSKNLLAEKGCLAISFKITKSKESVNFDTYFEEFHHNASFIDKLVEKAGYSIHNVTEVKFPDGDLGINMLLING